MSNQLSWQTTCEKQSTQIRMLVACVKKSGGEVERTKVLMEGGLASNQPARVGT